MEFPCIPSHNTFHSFVKVSGKRRARLAEADFNFIAACGDYQNDIAWLIMNTYLFSTCVQINVQNTQRFLNSELKYVFPSFLSLLAPSGALVFIMVYYIPAAQRTHFFKFFKFFRFESESESERTQHVLYF